MYSGKPLMSFGSNKSKCFLKIHGKLCLFGLVAESLLGVYGKSDKDQTMARGKQTERWHSKYNIQKNAKKCVTSRGNLLMSQTFKDFGQHPASLVGTSGLRQHSFLFAEKYNCMWAHGDIFRESAHDSLRTSVETRDDSTILMLLLLTKQSLLHPQITFLVRRRGPGKWCHPYLTFPSFVSWSVSELFYFWEREICTCLNYTPRRYRSRELAVWLPSGLLSLLWA